MAQLYPSGRRRVRSPRKARRTSLKTSHPIKTSPGAPGSKPARGQTSASKLTSNFCGPRGSVTVIRSREPRLVQAAGPLAVRISRAGIVAPWKRERNCVWLATVNAAPVSKIAIPCLTAFETGSRSTASAEGTLPGPTLITYGLAGTRLHQLANLVRRKRLEKPLLDIKEKLHTRRLHLRRLHQVLV